MFSCGACCESDPIEETKEATTDPTLAEHQPALESAFREESATDAKKEEEKNIKKEEDSKAVSDRGLEEKLSAPVAPEPLKEAAAEVPETAEPVAEKAAVPEEPPEAAKGGIDEVRAEVAQANQEAGIKTADELEAVSEEGTVPPTGCGWRVNQALLKIEKKIRSRSGSPTPGNGAGWKVNNHFDKLEAKFGLFPPHAPHDEAPPSSEPVPPRMGWKLEAKMAGIEEKTRIFKPHQHHEDENQGVNLFASPTPPGFGWKVDQKLQSMSDNYKEKHRAASPENPGLGWRVDGKMAAVEAKFSLFPPHKHADAE